MGYVHIKSFCSCQSQTYLPGNHLYICFLKKCLRGVPNAKDLDHLGLPSTWSCLLDLAVWRSEYAEMDSPARCAPRKTTLSFLHWIYSLPDSYTSCHSSLTKEIHLDHEAKLFTASFFLYGQATTRTTKQTTTIHPSPERWLHQCLEVPSFSISVHTSPMPPLRQSMFGNTGFPHPSPLLALSSLLEIFMCLEMTTLT